MSRPATPERAPIPTPESEAGALADLLAEECGTTLTDTALGYLRRALEDAEERGAIRSRRDQRRRIDRLLMDDGK